MINADINFKELLSWYADAGVDMALLDEPVDRLAVEVSKQAEKPKNKQQQKQQAPKAPPASRPMETPQQVVPDAQVVASAEKTAKAAKTLDELREAIEGFEGCNLKFSARKTVFAEGNSEAKIMLIDKAPRRDEDSQGVPFVGPVGQLLEKMLAAIGLERSQVYLVSSVPWATPGNRAPSAAETEICRPFIERHIELAKPELLLLMGGAVSTMLLQTKKDIMSLRGKWQEIEISGKSFSALPTLHPDYLLRTPAHKRMAWQDLLSLKERLEELE